MVFVGERGRGIQDKTRGKAVFVHNRFQFRRLSYKEASGVYPDINCMDPFRGNIVVFYNIIFYFFRNRDYGRGGFRAQIYQGLEEKKEYLREIPRLVYVLKVIEDKDRPCRA